MIGGVERKVHFFAFDLPHSNACFVSAYPQERTEAFCDGHVRAFTFFGGVPRSILYDNTKIAVARILGDGRRQRTQVFSELRSHYLFEDRFGRPGKGNDKGKVEGLVGYARRNFLVPIPVFDSFEALNARPTPYLSINHYQTAGTIEATGVGKTAVSEYVARAKVIGISWPIPPKDTPDGLKKHEFVRADTYDSRDDAIAFSITKAKQLIDQQGDRMFT